MDAIKGGCEGSSLDINVKKKAHRKKEARPSESPHPAKEHDADSCRARLC